MTVGRRRATLATLAGTFGNVFIVSVQAIVLIPLYLRYVGPRLYGAWLGSGDFLVWMQALDLGLPNLMIQKIGAAHARGDRRQVAEWFAGGTVVLAVVAISILLLGAAVASLLPGWMRLSGPDALELRQCFLVGTAAAALIMFNNSFVGLSRGIQDTACMNVVVLVSGMAGAATSLLLVLTGWGLWSIALGMAVRAVVSLGGSLVFAWRTLDPELKACLRLRKAIFIELVRVAPATGLGGASYALMNQSETALAAIFVSPESAAVLNLTRKAADLARSLLDAIGVASYGGFAHLVGSGQRQRALEVHAEINSLRLSAATVIAAAYVAVNASLVAVWVGPAQYGGNFLSIVLALQLVVVGGSYLINYLYRASGPVVSGSIALVAEAVLRVPLMIGLLLWMGLPGIPLAGIATGSISAALIHRWTVRNALGCDQPSLPRSWRVWFARAVVFAGGIVVGVLVGRQSWTYVIGVGSAVTLAGTAILVAADPWMRNLWNSAQASFALWMSSLKLAGGHG